MIYYSKYTAITSQIVVKNSNNDVSFRVKMIQNRLAEVIILEKETFTRNCINDMYSFYIFLRRAVRLGGGSGRQSE